MDRDKYTCVLRKYYDVYTDSTIKGYRYSYLSSTRRAVWEKLLIPLHVQIWYTSESQGILTQDSKRNRDVL